MGFPDPFYRWRPHPWHGLDVGADAPSIVQAYIEMTPFDVVKYETDKVTGYLRVDRPQSGSSAPPCLYGFVPRTYCDAQVKALSPKSTQGDGDPLDICVLSERPIARANIVLDARGLGGRGPASILRRSRRGSPGAGSDEADNGGVQRCPRSRRQRHQPARRVGHRCVHESAGFTRTGFRSRAGAYSSRGFRSTGRARRAALHRAA